MNGKEKFCRSFEWQIDIKWFDLSGYSPIDERRRARITLVDVGTHGSYRGFRVKILDKNDGEIDAKFFSFADYLEPESSSQRTLPQHNHIQVIAHVKWDWHTLRPKTTRPLTTEIEKYIEIFK